LNPGAVAAMRAIGIDITGHRSKHVDEFLKHRFDYVITVCDRAKEECPLFLGATHMLHWTFEDPAAAQGTPAERQQVFDRVRDEIRDHLADFLKQSHA
jgi:arsenate reductase